MQLYVCGFLFSHDRDQVVLILKRRPSWQAGHLNSIGSKIEAGESALDAMRREFCEEAATSVQDWQPGSILTGPPTAHDPDGWRVQFFRCIRGRRRVSVEH